MTTLRRRRATRAVGAFVALAALAGTAACTPASSGTTAVRLVDGRPALVVVTCAQRVIDDINVYRLGVDLAEQWHITSEATPPPAEVVLLEAPDGWTVTEDTLTGFTADREYSVSSYTDSAKIEPVFFTLPKLAELGPGQVLTGSIARRSTVVDEAEWRTTAERSCTKD